MKRKFLLIAASVAMMASCTQQEELITSSQSELPSSDVIGFRTNTTRAAVLSLSDMEDEDGDGFAVYATSTTTTDDDDNGVEWFLEGMNNYIYSSGSWGWEGDSETWPTDADTYPITFFALYTTDYTDITVTSVASEDLSTDTSNPVSAAIEIQAPESQVDILAATVVADTKPSDGKLSMAFYHILTKVDFGIIPGYNKTIYVNYFSADNFDNSGTYGIATKTWTDTSGLFTSDYDITDYLTNISGGILGEDPSESAATAITATEDNNSLMLLPQTATASDTTTWEEDVTPTGTLIVMRYRAEYKSSDSGKMEDAIGYADAVNHPDYNSETDSDYAGESLFVKVGYPLSTAWSMGSNYTYNIRMGTADATNGYLLDDYYYDDEGERTKFGIDFDKEIGEAISDGEINFDISVCDWNEETAEEMY